MNYVFIAQSIDGYIADKNGGIEWLESVPNPDQIDMGYKAFMERVDAIVMGRATFETVLGFGIPWPYEKPVFVLSNSLKTVPDTLHGKVELITGSPDEICTALQDRGYENLYIDGGKTIQYFLAEDLIDEMIITTIPVVLGGGVSLFGELPALLEFSRLKTEVYLDEVVQTRYIRKSI